MTTTVILLALAGTIISTAIGTVWYLPNTPTGKIHLRALGSDTLSPEERKRKMKEGKKNMPWLYAGQLLLSFLTSLAVVFIVVLSMHNGVSFTLAGGFVLINWLAFMVPTIGSGVLWSNIDRSTAWQKFFSDALVNLITVMVIAVMASYFA